MKCIGAPVFFGAIKNSPFDLHTRDQTDMGDYSNLNCQVKEKLVNFVLTLHGGYQFSSPSIYNSFRVEYIKEGYYGTYHIRG
jgi:hypothetical protein